MSIITPDTYDEFDPARIVFEPAKQFTSTTGGKFHRIFIKYRYDDDVIGALVVQTPILMTWGVSLGKAFDGSEGGGAPQMSLVSYNSDKGPTDEERTYIEICGQILAAIKAHMNAEPTKEELDKWDMASDVSALKVFYVKMERGKPVKGYPPTVYAKLYYEKPKDGGELVVTTRISDAKTGEELPQQPRLGAAQVYASLIFSNIFVGAKPSIQTRIGESLICAAFLQLRGKHGSGVPARAQMQTCIGNRQ
ncbi:unnamed protein product [Boreogadus saida]